MSIIAKKNGNYIRMGANEDGVSDIRTGDIVKFRKNIRDFWVKRGIDPLQFQKRLGKKLIITNSDRVNFNQ